MTGAPLTRPSAMAAEMQNQVNQVSQERDRLLAELWQLLHEETQRRRRSRRGAAEATVPIPRFLLQSSASAEAATPEANVETEGVGPPSPAVPSPRFSWLRRGSPATSSGQHVPTAPSPTHTEDSRAHMSWQHVPPPPQAPMRRGEEYRATNDVQRVPPAPTHMRWGSPQSTSTGALLQLQMQLQQQQHRHWQRQLAAISGGRWSPSAFSTTNWDSRRAGGLMYSEGADSTFPEGPAESSRARRRRARRRQNRQRNQSQRLPEVIESTNAGMHVLFATRLVRPPPLLESVMEVPWSGMRNREVVSVVSAMVNQLPTAAPAA